MFFFIMFGLVIPTSIFISTSQKENDCRNWLQNHGYTFVSYHPNSWGSSEECWGLKDGVSVRVY